MPFDRSKYPPDWEDISFQVRSEAGWKCEWCGASHLSIIRRPGADGAAWEEVKSVLYSTLDDQGSVRVKREKTAGMGWDRIRFHRLTKVICTTAHLDRDPSNNDLINLACLCQKCHLSHDILQHIANRRYGREHSGPQQIKLEL